MRPSDTSPEAWQVQIEIMRRKGPLERLLMACYMSDELHAWEMRQTAGNLGAVQKPE
jgi:hypothetical protein